MCDFTALAELLFIISVILLQLRACPPHCNFGTKLTNLEILFLEKDVEKLKKEVKRLNDTSGVWLVGQFQTTPMATESTIGWISTLLASPKFSCSLQFFLK